MIIIGADFHPEFQQIALVDTDTGEFQEKRLGHPEEAERFYRALAGEKVRVGMEASGHARWFERLMAELQFELWIGDAAEIPDEARTQAEDGSAGCAADPALAGGGSLSPDLGAELGEPRSAAVDQIIFGIESLNGSVALHKPSQPIRIISAASRRKMALAQRKRWASLRKQSQPALAVAKATGATPAKRTMSASSRRKIAAALRARWAKIRAAKKAA
jgi:hypothetical protein